MLGLTNTHFISLNNFLNYLTHRLYPNKYYYSRSDWRWQWWGTPQSPDLQNWTHPQMHFIVTPKSPIFYVCYPKFAQSKNFVFVQGRGERVLLRLSRLLEVPNDLWLKNRLSTYEPNCSKSNVAFSEECVKIHFPMKHKLNLSKTQ